MYDSLSMKSRLFSRSIIFHPKWNKIPYCDCKLQHAFVCFCARFPSSLNGMSLVEPLALSEPTRLLSEETERNDVGSLFGLPHVICVFGPCVCVCVSPISSPDGIEFSFSFLLHFFITAPQVALCHPDILALIKYNVGEH